MLNQIMSIVMQAVLSILGVLIAALGTVAISYINTKKQVAIAKIGADQYNNNLKVATNIWNIVDETFRITPTLEKTFEAKQKMFEELILKKLPWLTSDEIEHLRQAVAGEINKGKDVITAPAEVKQVVQPKVVYTAPDGTALQPVQQ